MCNVMDDDLPLMSLFNNGAKCIENEHVRMCLDAEIVPASLIVMVNSEIECASPGWIQYGSK